MNADPQGRARLLADVLVESDLGAWKERLRGECLARLDPTGRALLLRDLLRDPGHVAFEARLRAARGSPLRGVRRLPRWLAWSAAAALLLAGAWAVRRGTQPDARPDPASSVRSDAPAPNYVVRTRPMAPALRPAVRTALLASSGIRLDVVTTRPLAARLRLTSDRPHRPLTTPSEPFLERLDDAGLLALLPGRPSAIVELAPGRKRLVLLDPADEAALLAPPARSTPR